ncbi:MAG TPA: DedA family protein [Methylomirabilota bacterium]|jgi:membrane protein DedA with SNARE-associated domain
MEAARPFLGWLVAHTYVVVFLATVVDATGVPLPGRVLLVAAGAFAATGDVALVPVVLLGALGAMIGDHLWYVAGALGAQRVLAVHRWIWPGSREGPAAATARVRRFGLLTMVGGRFVAGIRIVALPLAAAHGLRYPLFVLYDAVGALVWSATFVGIGYAVGDRWAVVVDRLGGPVLVASLVVTTAVGTSLLLRRWRRGRYGAAASV